MAVGDKLYVADKPTQDKILSAVDGLSKVTSGGINSAVLNRLTLSDDIVKIADRVIGTTATRGADTYTFSGTTADQRISIRPNKDLVGIKVTLSSGTAGITTVAIEEKSNGNVLATKDVTGLYTFDIQCELKSGVDYYITTGANGASYTRAYETGASNYTSEDIDITTAFSTNLFNVKSVQAYLGSWTGTEGDATIEFDTQNAKSLGKINFNSFIPANTSIVCDVLDINDSVLITDVSDGQDLSSIDLMAHKKIKFKWSLSRISMSDTSPELHAPYFTYLGIQSWGWDASSPIIDVNHVGSIALTNGGDSTLLEISGSGYIFEANVRWDTSWGTAAVEIDGVRHNLAVDNNGQTSYGIYENMHIQHIASSSNYWYTNSIRGILRFNKSFKVILNGNTNTTTYDVVSKAVYALD